MKENSVLRKYQGETFLSSRGRLELFWERFVAFFWRGAFFFSFSFWHSKLSGVWVNLVLLRCHPQKVVRNRWLSKLHNFSSRKPNCTMIESQSLPQVLKGINFRTAIASIACSAIEILDFKHALAQTCLPAWYQACLVGVILGHSWGLVYAEGAPPVRYLCTT